VTKANTKSESDSLREALLSISEIANRFVHADGNGDRNGDTPADSAEKGTCTPKSLPKQLQVNAAKTATHINPANAPAPALVSGIDISNLVSEPLQIAVLTGKYWGAANRRLTVRFMETTPANLRARILSHLNAWSCGIQFVETSDVGNVRISRGTGGYWSYLGTDILHIATDRQTMNLQGFTMNTPDSEFLRVIRHEAGHTLGFPHEHMRRELIARIDPQKAYDYFLRTQGWNRTMVDQQVLTALDDRSIFATPADQTSIMCYQLPGSITRDGRPILGGANINATDLSFARRIYPPVTASMANLSKPSIDEEADDQADVDDSEFVAEPAELE
jgi:hypothetical protein